MATTADIRNGLILEHKNELYRVVEFQHVKPGKGGAFVRTKLKSLRTGRVIDETWNSGEKINEVRLERQTAPHEATRVVPLEDLDTLAAPGALTASRS